ncbi:helix-turn-helix domain-containing protein [Micromonospora chalcea]
MEMMAGKPEAVGPSDVQTEGDLVAALDSLRRRQDLSYEKMASAADQLAGGFERLPRSSISDILSGKTMPRWEKVRTFLEVCRVPRTEIEVWRGAWERARTAHLPRPFGAVRIRDADPRWLGVHAAITVNGHDADLPRYVPRDIDTTVCRVLTTATRAGGFVLLIGGSSVGKTRTLFEALRSTLPDWWLLHPASSADILALLRSPPARTVIWLDELQRYLDGPGRLTAANVRALLRAGLILAGTMWPHEYEVRSARPYSPDADQADSRTLLDLAQAVVVASAFTPAELQRADQLAGDDPRLDVAVRAGEPGIPQILAAGPDLLRRWEDAENPIGGAIITAAVDARRLGMQAPITRAHLVQAAPGYLTRQQQAQAPPDWLDQALAYATETVRGAAAALTPDSGGVMGQVRGYIAADYLVQRGFITRRTVVPPPAAWRALVTHADDPVDIQRLARSADARWRYCYAIGFYNRLAKAGDASAARRLAEIVAASTPEQAIEVLRPFTDQDTVAGKRYELMAGANDCDGLRQAAESGDLVAGCRLVSLLAATDLAQLRVAAAADNRLAIGWLVDHDGDEEHLHRLRDRANDGDRLARGRLVEILADRGQVDLAIDLLAIGADQGDQLACGHLADLLIRHGRVELLKARADAGDPAAEAAIADQPVRGGHDACRIAGALADLGDHDRAIAILQAHAAALVELTDEYLVDLLVACDRIDLLRDLAATGEWLSNIRLAELAAAAGDIDQLHKLEGEGNWFATEHLVDLLVRQNRADAAIEHLKTQSAAGNDLAAGRLPELLLQAEREQELKERATADPWYASGSWARHLAATGRLEEAVRWLDDQHGPGQDLAASQLAEVLVNEGRLEEAIDVLRPFTNGMGDGPSASRLVDLLSHHRRLDDLRVEVNAGASGAMSQLLTILRQQGTIGSTTVDRVRTHGVTAQWPHDGSPP